MQVNGRGIHFPKYLSKERMLRELRSKGFAMELDGDGRLSRLSFDGDVVSISYGLKGRIDRIERTRRMSLKERMRRPYDMITPSGELVVPLVAHPTYGQVFDHDPPLMLRDTVKGFCGYEEKEEEGEEEA